MTFVRARATSDCGCGCGGHGGCARAARDAGTGMWEVEYVLKPAVAKAENVAQRQSDAFSDAFEARKRVAQLKREGECVSVILKDPHGAVVSRDRALDRFVGDMIQAGRTFKQLAHELYGYENGWWKQAEKARRESPYGGMAAMWAKHAIASRAAAQWAEKQPAGKATPADIEHIKSLLKVTHDRAATLDDFVMENFGPKREADFGPHGNDEVRDRIDAMLAPMRDTVPGEGRHMTKITGDGLGDRVRINKGMREFVGKTGTVIGKEGKMWRVRLDHPVEVPGVGSVPDDLWEGSALTKVRGSTGDALDRFVGDALSDAELVTLARAIGTALHRDRPKEDQLRRAGMSEEANKIYARNKEEARSIWNAGKKGTTAAEFDKRLQKLAGARLNVKLERMGFDAAYDAADGPIANWLKGHGAKFIPDGDCAATLDRFVGDHWTVAARLEEGWQILQGAGTDGGDWAARKGSTGTVTKFRSRADAERHVHMETGGARDRAPVLDRFIGSH